jgi:glycosyltransferase involved in cell wall biosynthesis
MVIIPDRVSDLLAKGEITDRYYNPGDLFREVHIVLTNDDRPDPAKVQPMVGSAKLTLHNLPTGRGLFLRSLGWRLALLRGFTSKAVELAGAIKPEMIRCHGNALNALAAAAIKRQMGVPYIVSMHINPDEDLRYHPKREGGWLDRLKLYAGLAIEKESLKNADCAVCVYRFIEPYARRRGAKRVEVIYNVINPDNIVPKASYDLSKPVRIVVPGRQFNKKDPSSVIAALAGLPNVHCTLIGDGDYHNRLRQLAADLDVQGRCDFRRSVANDELCRTLKDYDILVSVNEYGGVSKVELEAAHVGMPILTNGHPLEAEPEVLGRNCLVVSGDSQSIENGLKRLIGDDNLRRTLGAALRGSVAHLSSANMEESYTALYREILGHA